MVDHSARRDWKIIENYEKIVKWSRSKFNYAKNYLLRRPFKNIKLVGNERKGLLTNFPKWRELQTKLFTRTILLLKSLTTSGIDRFSVEFIICILYKHAALLYNTSYVRHAAVYPRNLFHLYLSFIQCNYLNACQNIKFGQMKDSQRLLSLSLVLVKSSIIWISSSLLLAITAKMYLENTRKTGLLRLADDVPYFWRKLIQPSNRHYKQSNRHFIQQALQQLRLRFQILTCERAYSLRAVWPAEEVVPKQLMEHTSQISAWVSTLSSSVALWDPCSWGGGQEQYFSDKPKIFPTNQTFSRTTTF
jgi:hypothetical protein